MMKPGHSSGMPVALCRPSKAALTYCGGCGTAELESIQRSVQGLAGLPGRRNAGG